MFVSVMFIAMLVQFITMLLLLSKKKNNAGKLYHKKSMQVADEKLIINELGPHVSQCLAGMDGCTDNSCKKRAPLSSSAQSMVSGRHLHTACIVGKEATKNPGGTEHAKTVCQALFSLPICT